MESTVPSGTDPEMNVFLLPNQLPLFLLLRLGAWLLIVAGEPGLWSDFKLSLDDSVRMPRNLRTDAGRLLEGLVGDMALVASLVRLCWRWPSAESSDALPGGGDSVCGGEPGDFGVGCDDSGPFPGVGGRGDSGGLSSGAGIDVPSVREKLMGESVSGLNENLLEPIAVSWWETRVVNCGGRSINPRCGGVEAIEGWERRGSR